MPPRTWRQQRASGPHGFTVRFGIVRPARRWPLTEDRPVNTSRARRCRVHRISSRVRDDRDPPLLGDKMGELVAPIWPTEPAKCFCARGWTTQITLKLLRKSKFTRSGFFRSFVIARHGMRADLARRANQSVRAEHQQIAAGSIDAVEWGHDISCAVDCPGARHERATKNRSGHRAS